MTRHTVGVELKDREGNVTDIQFMDVYEVKEMTPLLAALKYWATMKLSNETDNDKHFKNSDKLITFCRIECERLGIEYKL